MPGQFTDVFSHERRIINLGHNHKEFRPHDGMNCPVIWEVVVDVVMRNGDTFHAPAGHFIGWKYFSFSNEPTDIMKYRVPA